jgi:hypothetical protein
MGGSACVPGALQPIDHWKIGINKDETGASHPSFCIIQMTFVTFLPYSSCNSYNLSVFLSLLIHFPFVFLYSLSHTFPYLFLGSSVLYEH